MKKGNNIIKLLLFIVLLFFPVISAHSSLNTQRDHIEISPDTDNYLNSLTPDNDASDEDQIDQSDNLYLPEQPESQSNVFCSLSLLNILFCSVWQPPKEF